MNLKHVLKIYTLERQLNADDVALLNTLRAMNDSERELLVESLGAKPTTKKAGKKAAKKSPRAASLQQQIQSATGKPSHLGTGPVCQVCSHTEEYEDHQQPSPHYHQFQAPAGQAASAGGE